MASSASGGSDGESPRFKMESQSLTSSLGAAFPRDPLKIVDDRFEPRASEKFRGLRGLRGLRGRAPQASGVHPRTPASPPRL